MQLSPGNRFGCYEILAHIGGGGMGQVYRARDTRLSREVAIKFVNPVYTDRFEREARLLAALNHPNIAAIYGFEQTAGRPFLVMEYVPGETLRGPIPPDEALPIAIQICEALGAAHERGIIHRDLKPANIKITPEGSVKVLDFGLAKAITEEPPAAAFSQSPTVSLGATRPGIILGTAAYMSPEQARGGHVDKRADIWACGVVFYEMLTGKHPFAGTTVPDTLAAVLTREPDLNRLPPLFRRVVRHCLEKDPKKRMRDVGDIRLALEEKAELPLPAVKSDFLWHWIAGLAVVIAAVSLTFWWRATRPVSRPLMRLEVELGPEAGSRAGGANAILSPDGTRIVYRSRGPGGVAQLVTRTLDREQTVALPGSEDATDPFFSPDGQSVGFFSQAKLKTISLRGGNPTVLCDAPDPRGASWGEDGSIIAALNYNAPLSRVRAAGETPQAITELKQADREVTHRWPEVLPGARTVIFTANSVIGNFDQARIEIQSLTTGERKTLVRGGHYGRYAASGHLLFVRDGRLYAAPLNTRRLQLTGPAVAVVDEVAVPTLSGQALLDISSSGTLVFEKARQANARFSWLDSSGHTQPIRATAGALALGLRFSPDGNRVAVPMAEGGKYSIWSYEWQRDAMTRLTFTAETDAEPVWAPDGSHIAFATMRRSILSLRWTRSDGTGEAVPLEDSANIQRPRSFSPDGRWLAFEELSPTTKFDIRLLPIEDPKSDRPRFGKSIAFLQTPFDESCPKISPDGHWLAYQSDESGANEVYVRPFPGPGGKWRISTAGGSDPVWSKAAHELFYRSREGIAVAAYSVNAGEFVPGKPSLWVAKNNLGEWFDLSPDGKRFLILESADGRPFNNVTFMLDFFDELRRRAPLSN